jgi:hypothetical protein
MTKQYVYGPPLQIARVYAAVIFIPIADLYLCKYGIERMLRKKLQPGKRQKLENVLTSINDNIKLHREL